MKPDGYSRRRLKRIASLCRGSSVLDIGYARIPNPFLRKFHVVGIDLARPAQPSGYSEELVGDATELQTVLNGREFDTIVAGELIEHLQRPYDFLRQLQSHLSPGGRVILSTPNPLAFPVIVAEYLRSSRFFYTRNHVYYFTPRWVTRMLDLCGYRVLRVEGVGLWGLWPAVPCPATLSYQVIYVAQAGNASRGR